MIRPTALFGPYMSKHSDLSEAAGREGQTAGAEMMFHRTDSTVIGEI